MNRLRIVVAVIALLGPIAGGARSQSVVALKPYMAAALADPARAGDQPMDAQRRPGAIVAFSLVKPADKVADLIPGSGYFTRIFSKVVGQRGHVYMIWPHEYAHEAAGAVLDNKRMAKDPRFSNVTVIEEPAAAFSAPEPLDLVFTSQNYHDYPDAFMGKIDPLSFDRAVFRALKPGGLFLIIDHVAEKGSGLRDTDTLHRIDPALVKAQVVKAGFVFEGESQALRNPMDDHKRKVFDPAIRGRTDQFIYRFRKP